MRILRTILLILLLLIVLVAVGGFIFYWDTTRGPLPQTSGVLNVPGLQAQVEVLRDENGIPHIYASNPHDLFFAQGLTQAQDRWWQMEFSRHIASGRIEELTGRNEGALGNDVFIRTLGWRRVSERDAQILSEETRVVLQAFANGVNAYINSRPKERLAMEYRLLGLTGVNITVEPWTVVDTLGWARVMAWNLTGNLDELTRATLIETLGQAMTDDYQPPYPYGDKPTIVQPEDLPVTADSLSPNSIPAENMTGDVAAVSGRLAGGIMPGDPIAGIGIAQDRTIGSNNWVAGGAATESGMPLLANDPHLGLGMPSIWYEIGLHCLPQTEACPYNVTGFAFSLAPGVIVGHNGQISWGVTNNGADVLDLYTLEINPDNELQYRWNDEWRDMTLHEETIVFGDGEPPLTFQVRETHLGPIVNDNDLNEDGTLTGFNNDDPVAMRWTGFDPTTLMDSVLGLNVARDWESFRQALSLWNIPSQNFVYADNRGNIGYQMPGSIPYRAPGNDGSIPVDGTTDANEWRGYVPFENLPRVLNPERGYIVTANQAIVPTDFYPQLAQAVGEEAEYTFSRFFSYGYRGQRLNQLMEELVPVTIEEYFDMHRDNVDIGAAEIQAALNSIFIEDRALDDWKYWLSLWNGQNNPENAQTVLMNYYLVEVLSSTFDDQLPEGVQAGLYQIHALSQLLDEPENVWWDDATTEVVETRDTIMLRALQAAADRAIAAHGDDREGWRWEDAHALTFISNPLGLSGISLIEDMVNRGPIGLGGGYEVVNAASWSVDNPFAVTSGVSMRMVVDFANLENSQTIHTTGQSGHPFSPHYDDMIERWATGEYHTMHFSRAIVEENTVERLLLNPA